MSNIYSILGYLFTTYIKALIKGVSYNYLFILILIFLIGFMGTEEKNDT